MKKEYDVIIIGGSAAGVAAGITARRHYPDRSILIIREQEKVSIPCGIPYIFGTVGSPENNLIPDGVLEKNNIDFVVQSVESIDKKDKKVKTNNNAYNYNKLILATGSIPITPPIHGIDLKNVFTIKKEIPYLTNLMHELENVKDLIIVGGGFIGVEFADESKKNRNINVSIIELLPKCCLSTVYDDDACKEAEKILKGKGINIFANEKVVNIIGDKTVTAVKLESGKEIKADMVILGVGSKPNTILAKACDLEISKTTGGIKVDSRQQTSDVNIFACGDCAKKISFYNGKPSHLMLASIATTEARIAGANLFKMVRENNGVIGAFSTVIGETAFAAAGITENMAKEYGYEVVTGVAEGPNRHPGGMPGMANLKVKLVFNKENMVILGGQIIGAKSGGELINVVGACIQSKMTADQIALFQTATHPALTASPIAYQLVNAAEMAIKATK
ncbi:MAG: FAD-dependent oxidoreductase [Candidatus Margulisbacteria bacterium]|nr:FAD-dependent oxidoreductase [Candidatus Margulisiibacteriota bacterium]